MNVIKKICLLILAILMIVGVCGCMNNTDGKNLNRKGSDSEYSDMMKKHMEEKYSKSFEIVDSILPEGGFNTEMMQNIVSLKDSDGVLCNVKADLNSPYDYYDDYIESRAASLIEDELKSSIFQIGMARIYVTVENRDINSLDVSAQNVLSLTFVGGIDHSPEENDVQDLYNMYKAIEGKGYENIYFLIGFADSSEDFDLAIKNYRVYGKSKWTDYSGSFYGYMSVKSTGLSFDEFKASIVKP